MKNFFTYISMILLVSNFYYCSSDTSNGDNNLDVSQDIILNTDVSGDGGVNPDGAKGCIRNSECPLGNVCINSECVEGCKLNADCPPDAHPERKLCNSSLGEHGRCVECLGDEDCANGLCNSEGLCETAPECADDRDCIDPKKPYCERSEGKCYECTDGSHCRSQSCTNHICDPFTGCDKDEDCKDPNLPHCDTTDNKCYECVEGGHCLSNSCTDHRCDPLKSCTTDRDCPPLVPYCDPSDDKCYECVASNQCKEGLCINHKCDTSLDCTKNGCADKEKCDSFTKKCYPECSSQDIQGYTIYYCTPPYPILGCDDSQKVCYPCTKNADCNGKVCDTKYHECIYCYNDAVCSPNVCKEEDGLCVECVQNTDCKDTSKPLCKDDNTCVQCLTDNDCPKSLPHCDERNVCRECLNDSQCSNNMRCDPFYRKCVECLSNSDCKDPARPKCDSLYHKCVESNIKAQCESCTADSECGSGNYCVINKTLFGQELERACAWPCTSDIECPKGYYCVSKPTVGSGNKNVCYPDYAKLSNILLIQASTCQGLKDVFKLNCNNQQDTCGLPDVKDSVCIEIQQYNISVCEIPCVDDRDCPDANVHGKMVATKCSEIPNVPLVKLCMPSLY
ncbi:MAG: hypothetical protein ACP5QK_03010 [Myxococcota bacterium]